MDHFFFPVAPHPEGNGRRQRSGSNGHQGYEQHEQKQNVTSLGPARRRIGLVVGPSPLAFDRWQFVRCHQI
jgi:hypothetical protein